MLKVIFLPEHLIISTFIFGNKTKAVILFSSKIRCWGTENRALRTTCSPESDHPWNSGWKKKGKMKHFHKPFFNKTMSFQNFLDATSPCESNVGLKKNTGYDFQAITEFHQWAHRNDYHYKYWLCNPYYKSLLCFSLAWQHEARLPNRSRIKLIICSEIIKESSFYKHIEIMWAE